MDDVMASSDFLEELKWRGMLHQTTGDDDVAAHLAEGPRVGYCGFDPTADSLTIGNPLAASWSSSRSGDGRGNRNDRRPQWQER